MLIGCSGVRNLNVNRVSWGAEAVKVMQRWNPSYDFSKMGFGDAANMKLNVHFALTAAEQKGNN